MSNIKLVDITGEIPFNANEHHDIRQFLGQLNGPSIGVHIHYTGNSGSYPNEYGGKTQYYNFCIRGEEALATKWFENLLQALVNCGAKIKTAKLRDIENDESIHLAIPAADHSEFVCPLRFKVGDADQKFEPHQLQQYLKEALVIDLNLEEAGMPTFGGEDCIVSAAADIIRTEPA